MSSNPGTRRHCGPGATKVAPYGSSLAPLLASGYRTITLVDLRYLSSDQLDQYIDFEDQDVLFLYSTLLLNNSLSMR